MEPAGGGHRLVTPGRLANDFEAAIGLQDVGDPITKQGVVVY